MAKSLGTEGILKQVNRRLKEYYDFDKKHGTNLYNQLIEHVDDLVSYQDRKYAGQLKKQDERKGIHKPTDEYRASKWETHSEMRVGFEAKLPRKKGYKKTLADMKDREEVKYDTLLKQLDTGIDAVEYIKKQVETQRKHWETLEQAAKDQNKTLEVPRFIDEILRDIPTVKQKLKELAFDKVLSEAKTGDEWKQIEDSREATLKKRLTVEEQNEAIIRAKKLQSTTDTFKNQYTSSSSKKTAFKDAINKLYEDQEANGYLIGQLGKKEQWTPTLMSEVVSTSEAMKQLQAAAIKKTESAKDIKEIGSAEDVKDNEWFNSFG